MTAELRLLGPPTLIRAGRPVRLHSAKTLALLAFLTLEPDTSHSREKLAALLWGDSPESRARQSLRQALYSLRRALGADPFVLEDGAVSYEACPSIWVDVLEFRALAADYAENSALYALRSAADLYRGMLLEGVELSDCPAFDEWLFFQRDNLEQQAIGTLQSLVDGLIDQREYQDALGYVGRLVALDPLNEGAHRRSMRVYSAVGDRNSVRRQYRLCADVLERELGLEPAPETHELYRALITVQPAPAVSPATPLPPRVDEHALSLPFLGRERDLETLEAQFDQAVRGQRQLVLMSGEAGVGKSRLVEEFVQRCAGRADIPVLYLVGRCYAPESRAPYGVWADALQPLSSPEWHPHLDDLAEIWRQQLARLVPGLGPPADEIEGATLAESRLRLLQGVVQALEHLAQARVVLLWFDDLHWADEASVELLHYVSRHMAIHRLFIIGTYRADGAVDNPYLDQLLQGSRHHETIQLAPLDKQTLDQMLLKLGIQGQEDLSERLYRHSGGNPLFLVETLNALAESGKLRREPNGNVIEEPVESWPVPGRIRALIQARLTSLGPEYRRALAACAVIGRPFGLRLLRHVSGLPEQEALDAVERALSRGFLEERSGVLPPESLTFRHPTFQRVIYEGLTMVQRRALHRRAANALLQLHQVRPQAVSEEVAYHFEQASDLQAVTYLAEAAQQAEELYALQHAAELRSRALNLLYQLQPGDLAGRFDLLLGREAVLDQLGRRAEQADDVKELVRLAETMGDSGRLALASARQAGFFSYTGRYDEAHHAGERALALYRAADDRAGEAQALRELGFLHWSAGDYGTALAYARDALQLHRRLGDVEGEATALHNLAEIHRSLGSPRQALAQYETALELYWARQARQRQGLALYGLAHALRQVGDLDQALSRYRQVLAQFEAVGDRLMASRAQHALAGLHWERGEAEQALDHMGHALFISREIGYGLGIAHSLVALGDLQAQSGHLRLAQEHLAEAITWFQLTEDEPGLTRAQARLHALQQGESVEDNILSTQTGWVKSHVMLAEGKVYCAFESPMAQQ